MGALRSANQPLCSPDPSSQSRLETGKIKGPGTQRGRELRGRQAEEGWRDWKGGHSAGDERQRPPATLQTRPLTSAAPPHQPFASKAPSARLPLPHFHSRSTSVSFCCPALQPPARPPVHAMDAKVVAVLALVLAALCISDGKCNPRLGLGRAGSSAPWLPQVLGSSAQSRGERTRSAPCTASELEAATLQGALPSGAFSRVPRVAPRFCALPSAVVGPREDCRRGSAGLLSKLGARVE